MTAMPFTLIAGPCVIESRDLVLQVAEQVKTITDRLGIRYVFKASFDKAGRDREGETEREREGEGEGGRENETESERVHNEFVLHLRSQHNLSCGSGM